MRDDEDDDSGPLDDEDDSDPPKLGFISGAAFSKLPRPRTEFATPKERLIMPASPAESKKITGAFHDLERKLGRKPTTLEVADAAGVEGNGNQGRAALSPHHDV